MHSFLHVTNASGARLSLSPFGARLVGLTMPDRDGVNGDVALGFPTPNDYVENVNTYLGATIGRVAGRTANAHFVGAGLDFALTPNNGPHTLHGGPEGAWDRQEWAHEEFADDRGSGFRFMLVSAAGTEGYPGTVRATSTYLLNDDNVLTVEMRAVTDAPTPVAMTQHAYWNLSSAGAETVVGDELFIASSQRIDMTDELVPTGDIVGVSGTGFDFTQARGIGALLPIDTGVPWPGIDHTYLLDGRSAAFDATRHDVWQTDPVATMYSPSTGRTLELFSTEPCLQVYLGCHLTGPFAPGSGICLETVRFPDSPLLPALPTVVLQPGDEYVQVSEYRFSAI